MHRVMKEVPPVTEGRPCNCVEVVECRLGGSALGIQIKYLAKACDSPHCLRLVGDAHTRAALATEFIAGITQEQIGGES